MGGQYRARSKGAAVPDACEQAASTHDTTAKTIPILTLFQGDLASDPCDQKQRVRITLCMSVVSQRSAGRGGAHVTKQIAQRRWLEVSRCCVWPAFIPHGCSSDARPDTQLALPHLIRHSCKVPVSYVSTYTISAERRTISAECQFSWFARACCFVAADDGSMHNGL